MSDSNLRADAARARLMLDMRAIVDEYRDELERLGIDELEPALEAYERETADRYTCPVCGRTSWHPTDVRERWCGACRGATGYPAPPGMRWVLFVGGELDGCGRLLVAERLERGSTYEHVVAGDVYRYDGRRFTLEPLVEAPA